MSFRRWVPLALLAATACNAKVEHSNPYDPESPPALQAKAQLVGKVQLEGLGDSDDRSGVRVTVQGVPDAFTGLDGSYAVANVPPGTYSVVASKEGYDNALAFPVIVLLSVESAVVAVPDLRAEYERRVGALRPGDVAGLLDLKREFRKKGLEVY